MIAEINVAARVAKIVSVITGATGWLTPLGGLLSPIMEAAGEAVVALCRGFFKGIAVTFANPAVLIVVLSVSGASSWYVWDSQQGRIAAAHSAVIKMRGEVGEKCPPATAAKIRKSAGVKPPPASSSTSWAPPGFNHFD